LQGILAAATKYPPHLSLGLLSDQSEILLGGEILVGLAYEQAKARLTWATPVFGSSKAETFPSGGLPIVGCVNERTTDLNGRSVELFSDVADSIGAVGLVGEVGVEGSVLCISAASVPGSAVDASGIVCCSAATGAAGGDSQ